MNQELKYIKMRVANRWTPGSLNYLFVAFFIFCFSIGLKGQLHIKGDTAIKIQSGTLLIDSKVESDVFSYEGTIVSVSIGTIMIDKGAVLEYYPQENLKEIKDKDEQIQTSVAVAKQIEVEKIKEEIKSEPQVHSKKWVKSDKEPTSTFLFNQFKQQVITVNNQLKSKNITFKASLNDVGALIYADSNEFVFWNQHLISRSCCERPFFIRPPPFSPQTIV